MANKLADNSLIEVIFLAEKLDMLVDASIASGGAEPKSMRELGLRLVRKQDELGMHVGAPQISGARNDGKLLPVKVHRAILAEFGIQIWPVEYYDPDRLGRDSSVAAFKRSQIPPNERISFERQRGNNTPEFSRDALFVMDVEDVSEARPFVGAVVIKPQDRDMQAEQDDVHYGKVVGTFGFDSVMVHIEHGDIEIRSQRQLSCISSESRNLASPEVLDRSTGDNILWHASMRANEIGEVELLKGDFTVGQFIVTATFSDEAYVDVVATASTPRLKLKEWVGKQLPGGSADYLARYQALARAKVNEQCGLSNSDGRRITLAKTTLRVSTPSESEK